MDKPIWELDNSQLKKMNKKEEELIKAPSSTNKAPLIKVKHNYFFLNQSLVKKIVDQWGNTLDVCWKQLYHYNIKGDIDMPMSDPMRYGSYFESLCLGSGAKGKVTTDADIPKNINGTKKKDQIRVELQGERFKKIIRDKNIIIENFNTQIPLARKLNPNDNVVIRGELDIFPTVMELYGQQTLVAIDLKLTADVNSTFGPYSWGNPAFIDFIQGDTYMYLIRNADIDFNKYINPEFEEEIGYDNVFRPAAIDLINKEQLAFIYWIFGYKGKIEYLHEQTKMINRKFVDPQIGGVTRQRENLLRYKRAYTEIMFAKAKGFPATRIPDCKNCACKASEKGDCTLYNGIEES